MSTSHGRFKSVKEVMKENQSIAIRKHLTADQPKRKSRLVRQSISEFNPGQANIVSETAPSHSRLSSKLLEKRRTKSVGKDFKK